MDTVDDKKCTSRKGSVMTSHENGERENEVESASFDDTEVVVEHRTISL